MWGYWSTWPPYLRNHGLLSSRDFATMATWRNDFSSLLDWSRAKTLTLVLSLLSYYPYPGTSIIGNPHIDYESKHRQSFFITGYLNVCTWLIGGYRSVYSKSTFEIGNNIKDNCLKRYMAAKIPKRVPDVTTSPKQNGSLSKSRFHLN